MKEFTQIIALRDVPRGQPFRVVAGPSGHLTNDEWEKVEFNEIKDKYLCHTYEAIEPWGVTKKRFFSPRFKVYVQEV